MKALCVGIVSLGFLCGGVAEANELQLEGNLASFSEPGVRVGVRVGEHTVFLTGLSGHWTSDGTAMVTVPAELKLYLGAASVGRLSPTLRVGFAYTRGTYVNPTSTTTIEGLQGLALVGGELRITETLGLGMELGGRVFRTYQGLSPSDFGPDPAWAMDIIWRTSLVLRF